MNDPWKRYHAMAARLGSLPPSKLNACPLAVQKILEEDMPELLKVMKAVVEFRDEFAECRSSADELNCFMDFHLALGELEL